MVVVIGCVDRWSFWFKEGHKPEFYYLARRGSQICSISFHVWHFLTNGQWPMKSIRMIRFFIYLFIFKLNSTLLKFLSKWLSFFSSLSRRRPAGLWRQRLHFLFFLLFRHVFSLLLLSFFSSFSPLFNSSLFLYGVPVTLMWISAILLELWWKCLLLHWSLSTIVSLRAGYFFSII